MRYGLHKEKCWYSFLSDYEPAALGTHIPKYEPSASEMPSRLPLRLVVEEPLVQIDPGKRAVEPLVLTMLGSNSQKMEPPKAQERCSRAWCILRFALQG